MIWTNLPRLIRPLRIERAIKISLTPVGRSTFVPSQPRYSALPCSQQNTTLPPDLCVSLRIVLSLGWIQLSWKFPKHSPTPNSAIGVVRFALLRVADDGRGQAFPATTEETPLKGSKSPHPRNKS